MPFTVTKNVRVKRDAEGTVRSLEHLREPFVAPEGVAPAPRALANSYVRDVRELLGVQPPMFDTLSEQVSRELKDEASQVRFAEEKRIPSATIVHYRQTHLGVPVWDAYLTVRVQDEPLRVTGSVNSLHYDVEAAKPPANARFLPGKKAVTDSIASVLREVDGKLVRVTDEQLLVYRYDPEARFDPESSQGEGESALEGQVPTLPLPPVPRTIRSGEYYVCNEVLFTAQMGPWPELHWRAILEVRSGSVLYLRAFVTSAFGNVFSADPVTLTGDTTLTPCSPGTDLDPLTSVVTILGLMAPAPGNPQALSGNLIALGELAAPNIAPPTAALPTGNFSRSAVTDDFAAVNCYHHCDGLLRMMQSMGLDLATYFPDTTFPLTVDHRDASLGTVNARGYGNATGNGAGGMGFNLAQAGCPVGIGADLRVVLHELCHELLWEHVSSPNFGFAHSAGDGLAAILLDPPSQAPDRFLTFPWISILNARRHDRDVTAGWAWGGANDDRQYSSEQILSTTLFRLYRSTGGDSPDVNVQRFAARHIAFLVIKGISLLTATTTDPEVYADAMMDADTGTATFDGIAGGGVHKVIRWSFEKQGLYQPAGAPTPVAAEGDPPDVDVYIDDGRAGEYQYLGNFWNSQTIWNRLNPGAGTEADHETPVVGTTNYLYVRVRNRGTQAASNVVVRAYHCVPATGLVWPDDWQATTTPEIALPGTIAPGGDAIAGPFEWTPEVIGHECLLASVSADGDLSNIDSASMLPAASGPSPHWRLVPFDNNIAQRNVAPVPGGGGAGSLTEAFAGRRFIARNPYERTVRIRLVSTIPEFLRRRGWDLRFANPGGRDFTLGPRGAREIVLDLSGGQEFTPADVAAEPDPVIDVVTLIDGLPAGGMSYRIDPRMVKPPIEVAGRPEKDCRDAAKRLLDCLDLPADDVKGVRIKRITVDIDLADDC